MDAVAKERRAKGHAKLVITAADGYPIGGFLWRHAEPDDDRSVVIVTAATSVRCHYYSRFAAYLFEHGFDVITFDYRGIGESRPESLRGFDATYFDWGILDLEAVLDYVAKKFPGRFVDVAAHSIGGFTVGLAPSAHRIRRIVSVGAQYAYWRDYRAGKRLQMLFRWHLLMPLITAVSGYFPGERLGWLEDTPRGVVRQWAALHRRFESGVFAQRPERTSGVTLEERFRSLTADILAVGVTDDEFGTDAAISRLLDHFTSCERFHLRVSPRSIGHDSIGHFAFFHSRYESTLWGIALEWLRDGKLPQDLGVVRHTPPLGAPE